MLDHTTHLRVKQDAPRFKDTPLHDWIQLFIGQHWPVTTGEIIACAGVSPKQVTDALGDLYRSKTIRRKQNRQGKRRFYVWAPNDLEYPGYSEWNLRGDHLAIYLRAGGPFMWWSINELYRSFNGRYSHDQVTRLVNELFRAKYLRRSLVKNGSHWFYKYKRVRP